MVVQSFLRCMPDEELGSCIYEQQLWLFESLLRNQYGVVDRAHGSFLWVMVLIGSII